MLSVWKRLECKPNYKAKNNIADREWSTKRIKKREYSSVAFCLFPTHSETKWGKKERQIILSVQACRERDWRKRKKEWDLRMTGRKYSFIVLLLCEPTERGIEKQEVGTVALWRDLIPPRLFIFAGWAELFHRLPWGREVACYIISTDSVCVHPQPGVLLKCPWAKQQTPTWWLFVCLGKSISFNINIIKQNFSLVCRLVQQRVSAGNLCPEEMSS